MNKIIFIRYIPLTKKIIEDFYMKDLIGFGYKVEYWDITKLFWSVTNEVEVYEPNEEENILIRRFNSKGELKRAIHKDNKALFISLMTFEWRIFFLFWYFTINHCKKAVFSYWPMPMGEYSDDKEFQTRNLSIFNRLRKAAFNPSKTFSIVIDVIKNRVKNKVMLFLLKYRVVDFYDYVFKGGEDGWKGIGSIPFSFLGHTKIYEVNNWDYNRFLTSNICIESKPYIVFLDEYYPFHPDAFIFWGKSTSPDTYFEDMNHVFSELETFYNMPVVIAAHPKALKYKERDYFEGRDVVFNETLEMVAKSSLVIAHDSLSIGYAVMCMKRILFVSSDEIKRTLPDCARQIEAFSYYFKSPMIWADKVSLDELPSDLTLPPDIEAIYNRLIKKCMTCVAPAVSNADLLKGYLKDIFDETD